MSQMIETRHEFSSTTAAWTYFRECSTNGLAAGYPELDATNAVRVLRPASVGHLVMMDGGTREAYVKDGEVFIAPSVCPLDIHGRRQGGRWECSMAHWERYFATLFSARVVSR